MTRQKDLKKLIRTRMRKTGESYTAARARLLARTDEPRSQVPNGMAEAPQPAAKVSPHAKDAVTGYAALAGMSDAAIQARTGCDWQEWVGALDYAGAADWSHKAIAEHVRKQFGVGPWWSQAVTVGYERIKGLRAKGQRRAPTDSSFEANKSKTFGVPVAELFAAWSDARKRRSWLPERGLTVRAAQPNRSLRITWNDGSSVELWFVAKGAGKSAVQVQHRKLASRAAADERKSYWSERLAALAAHLA
jgi:uncharacterized protein YndB with AHSA1/START domain